MADLKAGTRLKSTVCATHVMVVAASGGPYDLTCGGAPMVGSAEQAPEGGVAVDGVALGLKEAKALPSSD
jgi:hypothetical protein